MTTSFVSKAFVFVSLWVESSPSRTSLHHWASEAEWQKLKGFNAAKVAAAQTVQSTQDDHTPLENIGLAADSAGYVNCHLALQDIDVTKVLAPNLGKRVGLAQDIAGAVSKVAQGVTSDAVLISIGTDGVVEVGVLVPEGLKPIDVIGKLASSGDFVGEASAALNKGCCVGTKVIMTKEPVVVKAVQKPSVKSAGAGSSSDSSSKASSGSSSSSAGTEASSSSDSDSATTAAPTTTTTVAPGTAPQTNGFQDLIVLGCTGGGLLIAGVLLWNL